MDSAQPASFQFGTVSSMTRTHLAAADCLGSSFAHLCCCTFYCMQGCKRNPVRNQSACVALIHMQVKPHHMEAVLFPFGSLDLVLDSECWIHPRKPGSLVVEFCCFGINTPTTCCHIRLLPGNPHELSEDCHYLWTVLEELVETALRLN